MQPGPSIRWQRIDDLFHSTLALPEGAREAFLEAECGSDRELFDEVLSLVRADGTGAPVQYEECARHVAVAWATEARGTLAGRTIGRYRVLERLGAGAMGEVYRAEDTALGRHVALKTLLPFARDAARMRRLEHEARTASALNHPNILTIHEIGAADGVHFIAAELVDGHTLRDRLARGPLPLDEALDVAGQVAAGLGAAHAAGVIHRDIKPENLMVRGDGLVKIVDFGLAEPIVPIAADRPGDASPGTAAAAGTLRYMSPEQAAGTPLDARTDLFSLGVVLYEMVAGTLPVDRASGPATRDALLFPGAVSATLPPELRAVMARALDASRERRYESALSLAADLKHVRQVADGSDHTVAGTDAARPIAASRSGRRVSARRRLALGMSALAGLAGLVWAGGMRRTEPDALDPAGLAFVRVTRYAGEEVFPSLARAGDAVVYASAAEGNWDIYRHPIGGNPVNLTPGSGGDDIQPAYSPDGQRILFRSERDGGGLFVMTATGQAVRRVSDLGWDPAWSPDGRQIVCSTARVVATTVRLPESALWIVDVASGGRRRILEGPAYQPQWSPSGSRIAYFGPDAEGQRDIWTVAAEGGAVVRVTADRHVDWNPVWSADGRYLYFLSDRDGTMNAWRVRIDEATGQPHEQPRPFTLPAADVLQLARAAGSEALTFSSRFGGGLIHRYELDPVRATVRGKPVLLTSPSRSLVEPEISPDGTLLVANTRGEPRDDIVVLRADGTQVRALTEDEPRDRYPRWSPDGRRVAFWSDRSGGTSIFLINSDGSQLQQVMTGDHASCCPVWSPDGRRIAYLAGDLTIRAIDLTAQPGGAGDHILAKLPDGIWFQPVSWSADGSRLAGQERRGNNPRSGVAVYNLQTKEYARLTESGGRPIWLNDDRRLVYADALSAYVIDTATTHTHELFSVRPYYTGDLTVTRDNRRLYVSVRANEADVWVATPR